MYNASNPSQRTELIKDFIVLLHSMSGEKLSPKEVIQIKNDITEFVKNTGMITSYQLMTALAVNDQFAVTSPIFSMLFQHGPETNNPGAPSDLNGNMLHFYKGLPVLTQTENELVAFVMQPGFLEQHFYPVHPGWDMSKWSHVIEKQLQAGQTDLINPKTKAAFDEHAAFMSRMKNDAPQIEKMLSGNEIGKLEPQKLEDYDKYMKYKDADRVLMRDMDAMNKQFKDCGLADTKYVESKKEFSTQNQQPKPADESMAVANTNYRRPS